MIENVAIIGAGPAGLCCAKNSIDYGHNVIVYEQNSKLGGQWVYSEKDENDGIPVHSSIYKGLLTNVPIESMGFFNYPFKKKKRSFVSHEEVLAFYESYASEYNLSEVIKFRNYVANVRPLPKNRWEVLSKDLRRNVYEIRTFDAIFLCNGHYADPYIPHINGFNEFLGRNVHSHNYRRPDAFTDEVVLICGAGPSGRDISHEIATTAKQVLWSHHHDLTGHILPPNVKQFGDIKCFKEYSVKFMNDDDEHRITCILFCTGYKYSFPFLSVDCGISLNDMFLVQPLYKHLININFPTMAIVGLQICAYSFMYDLQARLCLKYFNNEIKLPSKERMLDEFRMEKSRRREKGKTIRQYHLLGSDDQREYFEELSESVRDVKMPEVLLKIYEDCNDLRIEYPNSFREFNYTIIDDETFVRNHITN